jgi:hypothetical protein
MHDVRRQTSLISGAGDVIEIIYVQLELGHIIDRAGSCFLFNMEDRVHSRGDL